MAKVRNNVTSVLIACGIWLQIGFIGATVLAVGLLQLFDEETTWLSALTLAVSGAVLAAASWSRGQALLERAERALGVARDAPKKSPRTPLAGKAGAAR
jgi:hypothetical protein